MWSVEDIRREEDGMKSVKSCEGRGEKRLSTMDWKKASENQKCWRHVIATIGDEVCDRRRFNHILINRPTMCLYIVLP